MYCAGWRTAQAAHAGAPLHCMKPPCAHAAQRQMPSMQLCCNIQASLSSARAACPVTNAHTQPDTRTRTWMLAAMRHSPSAHVMRAMRSVIAMRAAARHAGALCRQRLGSTTCRRFASGDASRGSAMQTEMRSALCGTLRAEHSGQHVTLVGWVQVRRHAARRRGNSGAMTCSCSRGVARRCAALRARQNVRALGNQLFLTLRDHSGLMQLTFLGDGRQSRWPAARQASSDTARSCAQLLPPWPSRCTQKAWCRCPARCAAPALFAVPTWRRRC